jgi:hypothetical protein
VTNPGDMDLLNVTAGAPIDLGPTSAEVLHSLKVVVEMVALFAPSLIDSGGFTAAKEILRRAE